LELSSVNTLFGDSAGEDILVYRPNSSTPTMTKPGDNTDKSNIHAGNIVMATPEELHKDQRKRYEEFQRTQEERKRLEEECRKLQDEADVQAFMSCFKKDRSGTVTMIKEPVLPIIEPKVTPKESTGPVPVTHEDLQNTINPMMSLMTNTMDHKITKAKLTNKDTNPYSSSVEQPLASAPPSTLPESTPQYGTMPNFFSCQSTPPSKTNTK